MWVVSLVHHLDDRIPDHFQRFDQRWAGERQDICSFLKLSVVAVTAYGWIDYPAADCRSGICGIIGERRRISGGRRRGAR